MSGIRFNNSRISKDQKMYPGSIRDQKAAQNSTLYMCDRLLLRAFAPGKDIHRYDEYF